MDLKTMNAIINVELTINKMLFRLKLEDISDKKRKGIETIVKDLDSVLEVLKMNLKEFDLLYSQNTELHKQILILKKEIQDFQVKELEL